MKLYFDSHIGFKYEILMDGINPMHGLVRECLTISNKFFSLLKRSIFFTNIKQRQSFHCGTQTFHSAVLSCGFHK